MYSAQKNAETKYTDYNRKLEEYQIALEKAENDFEQANQLISQMEEELKKSKQYNRLGALNEIIHILLGFVKKQRENIWWN